jgi:hypothetical protein
MMSLVASPNFMTAMTIVPFDNHCEIESIAHPRLHIK